jgi:hypothetical protein
MEIKANVVFKIARKKDFDGLFPSWQEQHFQLKTK